MMIAVVSGTKRRRPWVHSNQIRSVCTIRRVMCGSGWRTVGMKTILARQSTGQRGQAAVIAACAWCAAVPGGTVRGNCVHRIGSGSMLFNGTIALAFVSSMTWIDPFSLSLYIFVDYHFLN